MRKQTLNLQVSCLTCSPISTGVKCVHECLDIMVNMLVSSVESVSVRDNLMLVKSIPDSPFTASRLNHELHQDSETFTHRTQFCLILQKASDLSTLILLFAISSRAITSLHGIISNGSFNKLLRTENGCIMGTASRLQDSMPCKL